jgi:poly(3-hydroxybutyrate) depolymerase
MRRLAALLITVGAVFVLFGSEEISASTPNAGHLWGLPAQRSFHEVVTLSTGRRYEVEISRPTQGARPLIIMLPGVGETSTELDASADAYSFGRANGITIAYAQQLTAPDGVTAWNAHGCCDQQQTDDLSYLRDVVISVEALTAVDPHRVYLIGMSNGGMMALDALCRMPQTFSAAVSVAGPYLSGSCPRPTWLHLAGTKDGIVPVAGGMEAWCNCTFPSTTSEQSRFPGSTVLLFPNANHTWPRVNDGTWKFDGMTAAWNYLSQHPN